EVAYNNLLPAFLKRKWTYMAIIFGFFFASVYILGTFDKLLLPKVDQGQFMIKVDLPVGTRLDITNRVAQKIERFVGRIPEIKDVSLVAGSSKGSSSKEVVERLSSNQAQIVITL